ncbi:hypothetical protein ADILRU_1043 [Leifsonia rubra CMS 76R]|nr:hypothetical protein ADILRU_1043 [Leifsonia rubra CMS 76R]
MISFITLDFVLWVIFTAMTRAASKLHIFRVLLGDHALNVPGFGVPWDVVSD